MMFGNRKVTDQTVRAFIAGDELTVGNTRTDGRTLWLFGNPIAHKRGHSIFFSFAGWPTLTTAERLNGLLQALGASWSITISDGTPRPVLGSVVGQSLGGGRKLWWKYAADMPHEPQVAPPWAQPLYPTEP